MAKGRAALRKLLEVRQAQQAARLDSGLRRPSFAERMLEGSERLEVHMADWRQQQEQTEQARERQRVEFESLDTAGKVAKLRERLAEVHKQWRARTPWQGPGREQYWSRCDNDPWATRQQVRDIELQIAELTGAVSPEQAWAARRNWAGGAHSVTVPSHAEALEMKARAREEESRQLPPGVLQPMLMSPVPGSPADLGPLPARSPREELLLPAERRRRREQPPEAAPPAVRRPPPRQLPAPDKLAGYRDAQPGDDLPSLYFDPLDPGLS